MKTAAIAALSFAGGAVIATALTALFLGSGGKAAVSAGPDSSVNAATAESRPKPPTGEKLSAADAPEMMARFAEVFSMTESSGKSMGEFWWLLEHVPPEQLPELAKRAAKAYRRPEQGPAFESLLSRWAEIDPRAVAEFVRKAPAKSLFRIAALYGLAEGWSETDPATALDWAQHLPDTDFRKKWVIDSVLNRMAKVDPERAIEVETKRGADSETLAKYLREWMSREPGTALAWLINQPKGAARDRMIFGAVMRDANPRNAVEFIQLLQSPQQQDRLLQQTAMTWSLKDPAGVRQWMDAQTDPVVRSAILKGYISVLAQTDPAASGALYGQLPAGNDRARLGATIVANWYDRDPGAARAWAQGLPGNSRYEPMMGVLGKWMPADPDAALQWLDSQPMSPELRDNAIGVSSLLLVDKSPREALLRVQGIALEAKRNGVVEQIATQWGQYDPAAALAWVREASLPPEVKQRLVKRLSR